MKTLIFSLLISLSISCYSQDDFSKPTHLAPRYVPSAMLVGTFCMGEYLYANHYPTAQRDRYAITGMVVSVASFVVITTIQHRKSHKSKKYLYQ